MMHAKNTLVPSKKNSLDLIVSVKQGEPFTTTLEIASGVGLEHASVIKLVRRYQSDFSELGTFGFQIQKSAGRETEYAELNEDQATYLMTMFRNSDVVRAFKLKLVKAFRAAINEIDRLRRQKSEPAWQLIRDETKVGFKWMNETLTEKRTAAGKETKPHHYSNEARMINAILSGRFVGLDRNSLSASDLSKMADMQRFNAMLIAQDIPYQSRKQILMDRATDKLEHHGRTTLT